MLYHTPSIIIVSILFLGMLLFTFFGHRVLLYRRKKNPDLEPGGLGPIEGSLLGLLSLLLAFTFNMSASHYEKRRDLLVQETNDIGTAILRSDLYGDSLRMLFRKDWKEYVEARIDYYEAGNNEEKIQAALKKANSISQTIWERAAFVSRNSTDAVKSMQMIPAIGTVMDVLSSREEARVATVPTPILWMLFLLCFAGSFLIGYGSKGKKTDWIILCSYTLMATMTIFLILDLDRPRRGIINNSIAHKNLEALKEL